MNVVSGRMIVSGYPGAKRFKSTDADGRVLRREETRCPRRAINFVFRLNTRRWDCTGRKFISRLPLSLVLSLSLSFPWCGMAHDRGSLIAFRARAGCLSTHSVTEAVYRKFKLFRRTKSRTTNGGTAGGREREREIFSSNGRRLARALYASLVLRVENRCSATWNDFPRTDLK